MWPRLRARSSPTPANPRSARDEHGPRRADAGLLELIRRDPHSGWASFLERYADDLLGWIHQLGFDGDEAMDRFVFVCEKLADDRCRRLREVRHLGDDGELVPWLRAVVRNAIVSWRWSQHGRPRLPAAIERLDDLEQRVFRAHFWEGLAPFQIRDQLEAEKRELDLGRVFEALERVFEVLSEKDRWRLVSRLQGRQAPVGLDQVAEPAIPLESAERRLLRREGSRRAQRAMAQLDAPDRLLLQLRYEQDCSYAEMASILGCDAATARRRTARTLKRMRDRLQEGSQP